MFGFLGKILIKLLGGTRNERLIRSRMRFVEDLVNPLEAQTRALSDEDMVARSRSLRDRLGEGAARETLKPEAFALVREASRRARDHRQFDVQLVAGHILDESWIAEEATGEGKTVACYPAVYMAWLEGMHTHVVTTNDYLVQRDAEFARPVFEMLGMTVGFITSGMGNQDRQPMYACDVTYGTNSEFGFDYLRDNMKLSTTEQVQGPLDFAIIDEVDNILIDEARTPLIISGPAYGKTERYSKADSVARELVSRNRSWDGANRRVESLKRTLKTLGGEADKASGKDKQATQARFQKAEEELAQAEETLAREPKHYEVELDKKSAHMTHEGVGVAQDVAGVGSFYVGANMEWPHLMEQSLRAHLVYEKDKDYVVQNGQVVIVDEFTGRLMEGREWSDGLHQAVEAKERVTVKEENQTLATITLQNFFKLYKKLAGMTGTALTEAGEFLKIYKLDVAAVPTHRPVNRMDHEDRIYADEEGKYKALVEEIHSVSKAGRPVLVGTTSVEKSELLSEMLTRSYGVQHSVLNARAENAAREADIVASAGHQHPLKKDSKEMVGNVTIATNMAGRGTDIKLAPGVVNATCRVPDEAKLAELGVEPEAMFPSGVNKCCLYCAQYDSSTDCGHCFKTKLDKDFPVRGRTDCRMVVPCGLHIVGTERHEARRIDNQLRGRSGRQGDPGSTRFFLSLRDELMAIFAGEWTLRVLGWLGLQGDASIEDKRVSKGIERAQRKVEQRNFEIRKNLLEYDEVMDHQRHTFYARRQKILEGRQLEGLVMEMIETSVGEAVEDYLDGQYAKRCIAEWARQRLHISLEEGQVRATAPDDVDDLIATLKARAKEEAYNDINITLGEYMDEEAGPRDWDLRGLSAWAMSRFNVNLSQNQLRKMPPNEVGGELIAAAGARIDELDLSDVGPYLAEGFAERSLAEWARDKFALALSADELTGQVDAVTATLMDRVAAAYARREIEYPVEHAMDMTVAQAGTENVYALNSLAEWARRKYDADLDVERFRDAKPDEIYTHLVGISEQWMTGGKLEEAIRQGVGSAPDPASASAFAKTRFDTELHVEDMNGDAFSRLVDAGKRFLRREMTELERFVLLQIYDSSWKDHLLAMDHLKSAIGLRGFAEQDPRVAFKREGARMFQDMLAGVRDKITDMIFKVRLAAGEQMSSVYEVSSLVHEQLSGYDHLAQDMADQAVAAESKRVETIIRDVPKVGRNDPCPCGSGKKYKKCCGKEV